MHRERAVRTRPSHLGARLLAERGSALLLMPAGVLIMAILGSIALDQAIVVGRQRRLVTTAEAAAADGIARGVDVDRLRADGVLRWDRGRIDAAVRRSALSDDPTTAVRWQLDGDRLTVWLRSRLRVVFAPAVNGHRWRTVTARATASLPHR